MYIIQSNHTQYRSTLIALYMDAFSKGVSQQYIDEDELIIYIDKIRHNGMIYMVLDGANVTGAMFCMPLLQQSNLPDEIKLNFPMDNSIYIAELMVDKHFRGKGLGLKLLQFFFHHVDSKRYSDVFIRVWDQNIPALKLYEKVGFKQIMMIEQAKIKTSGEGVFIMNKLYLHKKI